MHTKSQNANSFFLLMRIELVLVNQTLIAASLVIDNERMARNSRKNNLKTKIHKKINKCKTANNVKLSTINSKLDSFHSTINTKIATILESDKFTNKLVLGLAAMAVSSKKDKLSNIVNKMKEIAGIIN